MCHADSIEKQISHWETRRDELIDWLNNHDLDHPNWEQNNRDRNTAVCKINQLKDRTHRPTLKTAETYSVPNINI